MTQNPYSGAGAGQLPPKQSATEHSPSAKAAQQIAKALVTELCHDGLDIDLEYAKGAFAKVAEVYVSIALSDSLRPYRELQEAATDALTIGICTCDVVNQGICPQCRLGLALQALIKEAGK